MSLVNLAHACSHLQNASLARLGLTSIPYTKLHLSLSLLLHKQGFLSQVKIGGLSPPASSFPEGTRDNHVVSAHPHMDRSPSGRASALTEMITNGKRKPELLKAGFSGPAIEFAMAQRELDKVQLERDGWNVVAADFLLEHGFKSEDELLDAQLNRKARKILQKYNVPEVARAIRDEALLSETTAEESPSSSEPISQELLEDPDFMFHVRSRILMRGFKASELKYFASHHKYTTMRHLEHDGVKVQAMGLTVKNQPFTSLPEQYRDPWQLEDEGVVTQANRASRRLWLGLKYWNGRPVLNKARMLSKPTKRVWLNHHDLGKIIRGNRAGEVKPMTQIGEIIAVSTDRGVMEARECVERKVGGMVLCRVW